VSPFSLNEKREPRSARAAPQHPLREQLIAAVERLTGRTVRMFLSGILGESWVEVFVLDPDGADSAGAAG
jgi:hypothetical protein